MGLFDKFCPILQKDCIKDKCMFWTHHYGSSGLSSEGCAIVLIANFG